MFCPNSVHCSDNYTMSVHRQRNGGGGLSPLIFQMHVLLIYLKKPHNYILSEGLSTLWRLKIPKYPGGVPPDPVDG